MKEIDRQLEQLKVAQCATEILWHFPTKLIESKTEVSEGRKIHDGPRKLALQLVGTQVQLLQVLQLGKLIWDTAFKVIVSAANRIQHCDIGKRSRDGSSKIID